LLTLLGLFLLILAIILIRKFIPDILPDIFDLIFSDISRSIKRGDIGGIALIAFSGGLFFFFLPLELIFLGYLKQGQSAVQLIAIFFGCQILSQTINYLVGYRLNRISRILIPPKKFYRLKGILNHYGPVAIFFINAFPLPSPVLSAILGVFRYNLTRFYLYTLGGQLSLYVILYVVYKYIIQRGWKVFW